MTTRFDYRHAVEGEIARSAEMKDVLYSLAEEGAARARDYAPVGDGDYRDGIQPDVVFEENQWVGRVNANDWKSHFIEFGTGPPGPTPAFAPLRKATDGLRI